MSDITCPDDGRALIPVALERTDGTVHKCSDCHGVWVGRELIERLGEMMESSPPPSAVGLPASVRGIEPAAPRTYRPCPACGALMAWRTCGGVNVDVCREDGAWFDFGELEPFVAWVRAGRPRSGTHHETLPLAVHLGLEAPVSPSREGAMESERSTTAEAASGTMEILMAVLEILTK